MPPGAKNVLSAHYGWWSAFSAVRSCASLLDVRCPEAGMGAVGKLDPLLLCPGMSGGSLVSRAFQALYLPVFVALSYFRKQGYSLCYIHLLLPHYFLWSKHSKLHHKPYRQCRIVHLIKIPNKK